MCRGSWLVTLLLAPLFLAAGCGGGEGARALRLLEFRQQDFDSVALNEELLFYFSSELDRSSITSDSVRVLDPWGREVAGTRSVRGDALSFLPDLPCASDLSDGGLQPEATYRVVLGGFPRPDGIRSSSRSAPPASASCSSWIPSSARFRCCRPGSVPSSRTACWCSSTGKRSILRTCRTCASCSRPRRASASRSRQRRA